MSTGNHPPEGQPESTGNYAGTNPPAPGAPAREYETQPHPQQPHPVRAPPLERRYRIQRRKRPTGPLPASRR
jgi:hypothetical protein